MIFRNSKLCVLCDAKCVEGYEKKNIRTPAQKSQENGEWKEHMHGNDSNAAMGEKLQTYISVADH
jgi:hypothetical protein